MRLRLSQLRQLIRETTGDEPAHGFFVKFGSNRRALRKVPVPVWAPFFDHFLKLVDLSKADVSVDASYSDAEGALWIDLLPSDMPSLKYYENLLARVVISQGKSPFYFLAYDDHGDVFEEISLPTFLAARSLEDLPEELAAKVFASAMRV
jgi:hypothetical protein